MWFFTVFSRIKRVGWEVLRGVLQFRTILAIPGVSSANNSGSNNLRFDGVAFSTLPRERSSSSCLMARELFLTFPSFFTQGFADHCKQTRCFRLCLCWLWDDLTKTLSSTLCINYWREKKPRLQKTRLIAQKCQVPGYSHHPKFQKGFKFQQYLLLWVWNVASQGFSFKTFSG